MLFRSSSSYTILGAGLLRMFEIVSLLRENRSPLLYFVLDDELCLGPDPPLVRHF